MTDDYTFGATSRKQWELLNSTATIVVYGGSMGGGKTYTGLLKHLVHVDNPHYRGVVIRKTSATLMKSGMIFDEARGIFKAFEPKVKIGYKAQKFVFPSGAEVSFTHLATDDDAEAMRGAQWSFAMCDEATELQEAHVLRVLSRIRSKAGIASQLVLTCNPSPSSFLRDWIDWWLIPKGQLHAGRVDPEKDCKIRWFLRINNQMLWGDSKEELIERHGDPSLPVDHDLQVKPISMQLIGASIYDNPKLIAGNPQYLANLLSLKEIAKERDLWGNWDIREEAAGYWKREWCEELMSPPPISEFTKIVRAYDFAGTLPSDASPKTDYFASVKMGKLKNGEYVILDVTRTKIRYGDWPAHILENARRDGAKVEVIFPIDPNAASQGATKELIKLCATGCGRITTTRALINKLDRFRPFSTMSQNGFVKIVKGCSHDLWNKTENNNEFFYSELEGFDGGRKGHDDCADCCSDAFMYLASKIQLGNSFLHGIKATDLSNKSGLLQIGR